MACVVYVIRASNGSVIYCTQVRFPCQKRFTVHGSRRSCRSLARKQQLVCALRIGWHFIVLGQYKYRRVCGTHTWAFPAEPARARRRWHAPPITVILWETLGHISHSVQPKNPKLALKKWASGAGPTTTFPVGPRRLFFFSAPIHLPNISLHSSRCPTKIKSNGYII